MKLNWLALVLSWSMWFLGFGAGYLMCSGHWYRKMSRVWKSLSNVYEQDLRVPTSDEVIDILKRETS